jgi:hypothetical protein
MWEGVSIVVSILFLILIEGLYGAFDISKLPPKQARAKLPRVVVYFMFLLAVFFLSLSLLGIPMYFYDLF